MTEIKLAHQALLFAGGTLITLGVLNLFSPLLFGMVFGAPLGFIVPVFLILGGVSQIVAHVLERKKEPGRGASLAIAVLTLAVGTVMLFHPVTGIFTAGATLAGYLMVAGALRLSIAYHLHPHRGSGWFSLSAIVSLFLGYVLVAQIQFPLASLFVLGTFVGVDMILWGVATLAAVPSEEKAVQPEEQPMEHRKAS